MSVTSKSLIYGAAIAWGLLALNGPQFPAPNAKPAALRASAAAVSIDGSVADKMLPQNRETIAREPLSVAALRDVALGSAGGDLGGARAGLELAERVSRRDQWTQLFLLEASAAQGRTGAALRRYDNLLVTSEELAPLLLQKLAAGLASPEIRRELRPYAGRAWMPHLLQSAAAGRADPLAAYALAGELGLLTPALPDEAARTLIAALLVGGRPAEAAAVADRVAGSGARAWRDFGFSGATTSARLGPLAWDISGGGTVVSSLAGGGRLSVGEVSGKSAAVASRTQALAAGDYVLTLPIAGDDSGAADFRLELGCLGGGGAVPVASTFAGRVFTARFRVSEACPLQSVRLMYRPDDHQGSRQFLLGPVALASGGLR